MIHDYLQENFGYSDFQIGQIRYAVVSILSEISKIIIMGIFFSYIHYFPQYLVAIAVLLTLRTCTGGLHFKHYFSCFLVSLGIIFAGVCLLPLIPVARPLYFILLLGCIIVNYFLAPIVSSYRPVPNGLQIKKSKRQAFYIITVYALIMFIAPTSRYTIAGFWIILLQSAQLIAAKLIKKEEKAKDEASDKTMDIQSM